MPWTKEDLETTWLAPERLLLFLQIAERFGSTRPCAPHSLALVRRAVSKSAIPTRTTVSLDSDDGFSVQTP